MGTQGAEGRTPAHGDGLPPTGAASWGQRWETGHDFCCDKILDSVLEEICLFFLCHPQENHCLQSGAGQWERQRWGRSCRGWLGGHSYFPVSLGSNQMVAFCVRSEEPGPSPPRLPGPASGLCLQAATGSVFQLLLPRLERSLGNPDLYCQGVQSVAGRDQGTTWH